MVDISSLKGVPKPIYKTCQSSPSSAAPSSIGEITMICVEKDSGAVEIEPLYYSHIIGSNL